MRAVPGYRPGVAIRVVTRDGWTHVLGADEGRLRDHPQRHARIVVFEPRPDASQHARNAALFAHDEWPDVSSDDPPLHLGGS